MQNGGQKYVIPCKDSTATVAALKRDVLVRCLNRPEEEARYNLVLLSNGAVLRDCDLVQDVLHDGDFIVLRELHLAIQIMAVCSDLADTFPFEMLKLMFTGYIATTTGLIKFK